MAKGSPLMGTQSGKLGESILYRQGGQQLSRAYIPNPKNPRTSQQIYQRMFMATMGKAQSAMHRIVDHSFEQVPHGSKSLQFFMKRNIQIMRQRSEFNEGLQAWVCPGMSFITPKWDYPTWNDYRISEGSLRSIDVLPDFPLAGVEGAGNLEDLAIARRCVPWFNKWDGPYTSVSGLEPRIQRDIAFYGGQKGDFFTCCVFSAKSEDLSAGAGVIYPCSFHWIRFQVVQYIHNNITFLGLAPSNIDGQNFLWTRTLPQGTTALAIPFVDRDNLYPYIDLTVKRKSGDSSSQLGYDTLFDYEPPLHEGEVVLAYCWIHSRPKGKKLLVSTQSMLFADTSGDVYDNNLGMIDAYDEWLSLRKPVGNATDVLDGGA